jgi:Skp family chaperone for outer membrane proteins
MQRKVLNMFFLAALFIISSTQPVQADIASCRAKALAEASKSQQDALISARDASKAESRAEKIDKEVQAIESKIKKLEHQNWGSSEDDKNSILVHHRANAASLRATAASTRENARIFRGNKELHEKNSATWRRVAALCGK